MTVWLHSIAQRTHKKKQKLTKISQKYDMVFCFNVTEALSHVYGDSILLMVHVHQGKGSANQRSKSIGMSYKMQFQNFLVE